MSLTCVENNQIINEVMFTKRGNKPRVPSSIPVTSYVQRLALCSSHLANISVSVKQVRVEKRS